MNAKILISMVLLTVMMLCSSVLFAQSLEEAMVGIRSPEDLVSWMSKELTYVMTLPGKMHLPEETLQKRSGDCDDFAVLASTMLTRMGIANDVIIIRFRKLSVAHAICIWKGKNGYYNFISNCELHRTGRKTVAAAIKRFYPDCEAIASIDPKMYIGTLNSSIDNSRRSRYYSCEPAPDLNPQKFTSL